MSPPQTANENYELDWYRVRTPLALAPFTWRNARPVQFEADIVGTVVRSEPEVKHILCRNDVSALWKIGSAESSDYVRG